MPVFLLFTAVYQITTFVGILKFLYRRFYKNVSKTEQNRFFSRKIGLIAAIFYAKR